MLKGIGRNVCMLQACYKVVSPSSQRTVPAEQPEVKQESFIFASVMEGVSQGGPLSLSWHQVLGSFCQASFRVCMISPSMESLTPGLPLDDSTTTQVQPEVGLGALCHGPSPPFLSTKGSWLPGNGTYAKAIAKSLSPDQQSVPAQAEALAHSGTKHGTSPFCSSLSISVSAWEKKLVGFVQLLMQECKTMMLLLWNPARPLLPAASSKVRDVFGTSSFLCFRWEILTQQAGTFQSKLSLWMSSVLVRVSEGSAFPLQCFRLQEAGRTLGITAGWAVFSASCKEF